jgi:hypothetical protein
MGHPPLKQRIDQLNVQLPILLHPISSHPVYQSQKDRLHNLVYTLGESLSMYSEGNANSGLDFNRTAVQLIGLIRPLPDSI